MSQPDKPETPKDDDTPETVEAEIVENDDAKASEEKPHLEGETVEKEAPAPRNGAATGLSSLASPGVILLGLMAIALVIVMLTRGEPPQKPADDTVLANAGETSAPSTETSESDEADLFPATDDDEKEPQSSAPAVEETQETATLVPEAPVEPENTPTEAEAVAPEPAEEAEAVEDVTESIPEVPVEAVTAVVSEDEATDTPPAEEFTANEPLSDADRRRAEAIERARKRREALRSASDRGDTISDDAEVAPATEAVAETVTKETDTTQPEPVAEEEETPAPVATASDDTETPTTEETLPETPALVIAAEDVVTDEKLANQLADIKSDVKKDVLAQTQAALEAEQERARRQDEEIDRLKNQLEDALEEQEQRSAERMAELEQRMNKLQNRDVATATKQAAISIALSNLQRQMYSGAPFKEQLDILEGLVTPSRAISDLKPFAETGLPTMLSLQTGFSDAARSALAAAKRENAKNPMEQFGANLSSLFSVRKTGKVEGDTPSAIISRAEANLEEGNLYEALREIGTLEGDAAAAMDPWVERARSRVAADQLLTDVSSRVLTRL
jgi:hypothetical protein